MKALLRTLPLAALLVATPVFTGCNTNANNPNPESRVNDKLKDAKLSDVNANWNKDERALHLSGTVDRATDKQRAEDVASQVVGTSGRVVNEVKVKDVDTRNEDKGIEDRLDAIFKDSDDWKQDNLDVKYSSKAGVVTVNGTAPSDAMKTRVTEKVRSVEGVKDVVNDMDVKPTKGATAKPHTKRHPK